MSSPVKFATQPDGSTNSRIAANSGAGPMSNQCVVFAGTLSRSPRVQIIWCTLPPVRR
jgi:hypothetical protein